MTIYKVIQLDKVLAKFFDYVAQIKKNLQAVTFFTFKPDGPQVKQVNRMHPHFLYMPDSCI